jgi:hypothetical protein
MGQFLICVFLGLIFLAICFASDGIEKQLKEINSSIQKIIKNKQQ